MRSNEKHFEVVKVEFGNALAGLRILEFTNQSLKDLLYNYL